MVETKKKYAEGSDLTNAVLDGADCVMLSGANADWNYPLTCLRTVASLAREAEALLWNERILELGRLDLLRDQMNQGDKMDITTATVVYTTNQCKATAIIDITNTDRTAKMASKYKPSCPILVVTRFPQAGRQMHLHRGIIPLHYPGESNTMGWKESYKYNMHSVYLFI